MKANNNASPRDGDVVEGRLERLPELGRRWKPMLGGDDANHLHVIVIGLGVDGRPCNAEEHAHQNDDPEQPRARHDSKRLDNMFMV
jgi:hypothetical protein